MKTIFSILLFTLCITATAQQKVLHYTETSGFDHNTRIQSLQMFQSFETDLNIIVTDDETGSPFSSLDTLLQYAVVIFSNTSGTQILTATQRANFEAYIAAGGSYLGIHAASDTYRHSTANGGATGTWDWYAETVAGASVQQNPNHTSPNHNNTMTKTTPGHPTLASVPSPWNKTEEYYYWENGYLSPYFTELLRVGSTGSNSRDIPRMMAQCRELPGGGRAFYTALGHAGSNYTSDSNFIALIHDALEWELAASGEPYAVDYLDVASSGSYIVWEAPGAVTIEIELLIPEIGEYAFSVRYHNFTGSHELRGCGKKTARIRAIAEDSHEIVSESVEVEARPFSHLVYGVLHVDCTIGDPYTVTDTSGRHITQGIVQSAGIDLQGLSPGIYVVKIGNHSYTVIR